MSDWLLAESGCVTARGHSQHPAMNSAGTSPYPQRPIVTLLSYGGPKNRNNATASMAAC